MLLPWKATIMKYVFWVELCPCFEVVDEFKSDRMRATFPKHGHTSCLVSTLLKLGDTSLDQADLGDFLERVVNPNDNSIMGKIVRSGLIEDASFPTIAPCHKLSTLR